MRAFELVVSIRHDDESRHRVDPPGEQAEDVESRLVRPVHVLEDQDGRARRELVANLLEDVARRRGACEERVETRSRGKVRERAERSRREQRIARADEDTRCS